jgi:hypothetical protein
MKKRTAKRVARAVGWEQLGDEELLQMRVRDLGLEIEESAVEPFIERLYDEPGSRGIGFRPSCYSADEWLCPDKTPVIGIPFYLANGRLKHIEKKMMFDVEGVGGGVSC